MDRKFNVFVRLLREAFDLAKNACNCSFDDPETNKKADKCSALSYAAACTAKYSAATAIYWTMDEHEAEFDDVLHKFDVFTRELRTDFRDNHSRQWVEIEFERLEEAFEKLPLN